MNERIGLIFGLGLVALCIVVLAVIILDAVQGRKIRALEEEELRQHSVLLSVKTRLDQLEEDTCDHRFKLRNIAGWREDFSDRLREVENALYDVHNDAK